MLTFSLVRQPTYLLINGQLHSCSAFKLPIISVGKYPPGARLATSFAPKKTEEMLVKALLLAASVVLARDIKFPPAAGYQHRLLMDMGSVEDVPGDSDDLSQAKFAGLLTFAHIPYVHCLAGEKDTVEPFDIAILGAPFDTVAHSNERM
jgi:hypothetical protein